MNDCVKEYLTEIIVTSAAFGASFILNCLMACKLYYKSNTKEKPQEVELVTLNNEKKESNIEDYVMTIGEKREIVRGNLPNWVIEDYKNKKILRNK